MTKRNLPSAPVSARPGVKTEVTETAVNRWNPDLQASVNNSDENSISILDPIGADFWGDGVTPKRIAAALRAIGDKDVVVNINSPGGNYFDGLAIYNLLLEHPGHVTVKVLGMAASAASIIAMAGDTILVGRASFIMIHNTWVCACGDRHSFREVADWLEPFDEAAVGIYAARTGISDTKLGAMLDKETWIGGASAIDQGFADEFLSSDDVSQNIKNSSDLTPKGAQKKLDLVHASGQRLTKSQSRELLAAARGGMSGAAPTSTSGAAEVGALNEFLFNLKNM